MKTFKFYFLLVFSIVSISLAVGQSNYSEKELFMRFGLAHASQISYDRSFILARSMDQISHDVKGRQAISFGLGLRKRFNKWSALEFSLGYNGHNFKEDIKNFSNAGSIQTAHHDHRYSFLDFGIGHNLYFVHHDNFSISFDSNLSYEYGLQLLALVEAIRFLGNQYPFYVLKLKTRLGTSFIFDLQKEWNFFLSPYVDLALVTYTSDFYNYRPMRLGILLGFKTGF